MRILAEADVEQLAGPPLVLDQVDRAMRALARGEGLVPPRPHLTLDRTTLLAMPAAAAGIFSTKLVTVAPGNRSLGLPLVNGLLVVHDGTTGQALALMGAGQLTALRTGAVGAIGVRLLTPADQDSVGIVGCGTQGMHQALFAALVRPIRTIHLLDRNRDRTERFTAFLGARRPDLNVVRHRSVEAILERTSLVITATTSATPVIPDDPGRVRGHQFIAIGGYRPDMRELPDAVTSLAGELWLDSEGARHETGDAVIPVARNILQPPDIHPIGDLLTGARQLHDRPVRAYKSAGMALFDLYLAAAVCQAAAEGGWGKQVDL